MKPASFCRDRALSLAACALALLGLLAVSTRADDPGRQWQKPDPGMGAFQRILMAQGLLPLTRLEQLRTAPSHTLLIVLGQPQVLRQVPDDLQTFLERGGAVLVATDQDSRGATLIPLGAVVDGQAVQAPTKLAYRGVPDCPVITDFVPGHEGLFRGVRRIATNRPSYLLHGHTLPVLARFSAPSFVNDVRAENRLAFAAGGNRLPGQFLFLADHSVFIDGMILQKDNDNFTFAYNCVDWLRTTPKGKRDRALLIVDGEILTGFGTPVPYLPNQLPAADVNKALTTLEERDAFNRLLLNFVPKERLWQVAVVALSLVLLGYGLFRLVRARHRVEEGAPLFALSLARAAPARSLADQRAESALAEGNLSEAARSVAQQFLASAGSPGERPPAVHVRGGLWTRRALTGQVHRLWQLAHEAAPPSVSPQQIERLLAEIETLKRALADGTLRLEVPTE